jgi:hypothetical protein
MPAASYGVLATTVATAGTILAGSAALALTWKGRFRWEPIEEDIPRAARQVGGLLTAILIAILWYLFSFEHRLSAHDLIRLSIIFALVGLASMIVYGLLVGVLVYDKEIAISSNKTANVKIIGGFWLTQRAKKELRSGKPRPGSIVDLLRGAAYNADLVWPRFSRALAKTSFQLAYITLVGSGTCALACTSLLVASTVG